MTQTFACWRCGATRRFGDNHCCGRAARAPRRQLRRSPVADLTFGMLIGLVVWIAAWLVIGALIWGPWRFT